MIQPWENLAAWLKAYDPHGLKSEGDVEARFVLPLFRLLGYPDDHLHSKDPIASHEPGKVGRKREADVVYYAHPEPERQSAKTTLVLVEAKEPGQSNLIPATLQGQTYSESFRPLLVCVTNGKHLLVLRRHRYEEDERVFDAPVSTFSDPEQCRRLYDLLNFETMREQRDSLSDELRHDLHVAIARLLRDHPDIQKLLVRGDFNTYSSHIGEFVHEIRPKVRLVGRLPVGFGKGACEVVFSNLLRSDLTIHLSHRDLVKDCMMGMGDPPVWGTHRFIKPESKDRFFVMVGQTMMFLSAAEANDLCACIDVFCGLYRDMIIEVENTLETWNYPNVPSYEGTGYQILSVPARLWKMIMQFAWQLNQEQNIPYTFDILTSGIRVVRRADNIVQAHIQGVYDGMFAQEPMVSLVYIWSDYQLEWTGQVTKAPWQQSVGEHGIWTARATHSWLVKTLFPEICRRYGEEAGSTWSEWEYRLISELASKADVQTLRHVNSVIALSPYLHVIQSWFGSYKTSKIAARLFCDFFAPCLVLARQADPNRINLHYIASNIIGLKHATWEMFDSFQLGKHPEKARQVFATIIERLNQQIEQLRRSRTMQASEADFLMRSMITILEQGNIHCGQAELTAARTAVESLWQRARFDRRHVWPQIQR